MSYPPVYRSPLGNTPSSRALEGIVRYLHVNDIVRARALFQKFQKSLRRLYTRRVWKKIVDAFVEPGSTDMLVFHLTDRPGGHEAAGERWEEAQVKVLRKRARQGPLSPSDQAFLAFVKRAS